MTGPVGDTTDANEIDGASLADDARLDFIYQEALRALMLQEAAVESLRTRKIDVTTSPGPKMG
jgi:hypothetical protein